MTELLNLGKLYPSDFLAPGEEPRSEPVELKLVMNPMGVVHLEAQPAPELMWGRYWYRSGTNESMRRELHGISNSIIELGFAQNPCLWVDIASNDGTLLAGLPTWVTRVGVDPVEGDIFEEARHHTEAIVRAPFTHDIAREVRARWGHAEVITCIAMFYDLLDPTDFLAGVKHLLVDDGVFVLQMSYTPLMLEQLAFDNICHEHARYYSMQTLHETLGAAGFQIMDATLNPTNGGSIRVYTMHNDADVTCFGTAPYRDVMRYRMRALAAEEVRGDWNRPEIWRWFKNRLASLRADVVGFIRDARANGETVWGYGASTKGNTLLQYFGLDHTMIEGIAERQETKWGLRTVGTNIPITSEDDWRTARPDYTLMLPWHFVSEFTRREAKYLEAGGKFIVPCPRFEIISA